MFFEVFHKLFIFSQSSASKSSAHNRMSLLIILISFVLGLSEVNIAKQISGTLCRQLINNLGFHDLRLKYLLFLNDSKTSGNVIIVIIYN